MTKTSDKVNHQDVVWQDPGAKKTRNNERREKLYDQVELVKLVNLKKLRPSDAGEPGPDEIKAGEAVLKAVKAQLEIMDKQERDDGAADLPVEVDAIWKAMLRTPALGPLLRREAVRRQLMEALKRED